MIRFDVPAGTPVASDPGMFTDPTPSAIRSQVDRMCSSRLFATSPRLSSFLRFTVEQTLNGNEQALKEYLVGVSVFGRPDTFDPRLDSIVRVEARRLRAKVANYYSQDGASDDLLVHYQRGDYVPRFLWRGDASPMDPAPAPDSSSQVVVLGQDRALAHRLADELSRLGYTVIGVTTPAAQARQWKEPRASSLMFVSLSDPPRTAGQPQ